MIGHSGDPLCLLSNGQGAQYQLYRPRGMGALHQSPTSAKRMSKIYRNMTSETPFQIRPYRMRGLRHMQICHLYFGNMDSLFLCSQMLSLCCGQSLFHTTLPQLLLKGDIENSLSCRTVDFNQMLVVQFNRQGHNTKIPFFHCFQGTPSNAVDSCFTLCSVTKQNNRKFELPTAR